MRRPVVLAAALVAAGLTVAVAAPSLHYGFVYDDKAVVLERKPFWELGLAGFLESRPHGTGRHLTAVSLDLDRLQAGTVPLPFHRTNILLAALLSALVLVFALRVGLSLPAALAAAAIFAVHPVHVDAVAWITGRSEVLAALGVIAALIVCIRPAHGPPKRSAWFVAFWSALLATIAVHSKESALCLPLLIVIARLFLGPRVAWVPALAGTAVAVASWVLLASSQLSGLRAPQFVDNPLVYAPAWQRIPMALDILWQYAVLLVWPHPLLQDRSYATTDPSLTLGFIAAAGWIAAAVAVWRVRRSYPIAAFAIAWFPAAFAVTSNVARPIGTLMAERLLLLPSLSICLLAGFAVDRFATGTSRRRIAAVATTAIAAALFLLFRARAAPWESEQHYFVASAMASPRSAKAQYDYGSHLLSKGRPADAEAAFARALEIDPSLSRAASLRAESMARRGDPSGGAEVYLAYLAVRPDDAGAVTNVTRLLLDAGRYDEAVRWAQRLVEMSPGDQTAIATLVLAETAARRAQEKAPVRAQPDAAHTP